MNTVGAAVSVAGSHTGFSVYETEEEKLGVNS